MDIATLVGIAVSMAVVIFSICFQDGSGGFFDAASLGLFFDTRAFLLVAGGTFGAAVTQYPLSLVLGVVSVISRTVMSRSPSTQNVIKTMTEMAYRARREGMAALQPGVEATGDPFVRKGLQLTVDGLDPVSIKNILEAEVDNMQVRHERGANVLESMATYAPALGMMGTVIGLVQMLNGMQDPSSIGPKMALALITTFYGVVLANLVFLPLAGRLRLRSREEIFLMEMEMEGIVGIAAGENPRLLHEKLTSFQSPRDRREATKWHEEP